MKSGIYQIENEVNGKRYVGSAVDVRRRWRDHRSLLRHGRHNNPHLQAAFKKYGEVSFAFSVLEQAEPEKLIGREQWYLDTVRPEYNISLAARSPMLGRLHTAETRRKMSKAQKGHPVSEETLRHMSEVLSGERNGFYGKHHSEETRRRMSEAVRGERNPNYGKHPSVETRAKMSVAQKARQRREHTA